MFFSFIKQRYWWPRRGYVLTKGLAVYLTRDTSLSKVWFIFKNRYRLIGTLPKFMGIMSRARVAAILRRNSGRRAFNFRFFMSKIRKRNENRKKLLRLSKVWVRFSANNIFFSITDPKNKLLTYFSSGSVGFSGPAKTSSFALDQIISKVVSFFKKRKLKSVNLIFLNGVLSYRARSVIDSIIRRGLLVKSVTYKVKLPHNGLRKRKAKRR